MFLGNPFADVSDFVTQRLLSILTRRIMGIGRKEGLTAGRTGLFNVLLT